MTTITSALILRRTTAFLSLLLSNLDRRQRILSSARRHLPSPPSSSTLHALSLLSSTLSPSLPALTSASYSAAASHPSALSALLLAISFALRRRHADAARAILDVFSLDPSAARADIAPEVFEELFLPHLFPAVRWFAERRARVMERVGEGMAVLSAMSDGQAGELRELEDVYEGVMDENVRVYAGYLKEVLMDGDADGISPPELVLPAVDDVEVVVEEEEEEEEEEIEEMGLMNGRFNVMPFFLADESN